MFICISSSWFLVWLVQSLLCPSLCVFYSASPVEISLVSMFGDLSVSLVVSQLVVVKFICLSLGLLPVLI